jgi:hypothetical protein
LEVNFIIQGKKYDHLIDIQLFCQQLHGMHKMEVLPNACCLVFSDKNFVSFCVQYFVIKNTEVYRIKNLIFDQISSSGEASN